MPSKHQHYQTSYILQSISESAESTTITVGQFVKKLGDRSFGLAILVFSLPNSLPVPGIPGFSTITGIPIMFIGLQMMLGKKSLWMPKSIANKSFSQKFLAKMLLKTTPFVIKLEKLLKPRLLFVTSPWGERLLGLMFFILASIMVLPIPGGNFLPGISMSLLALGMLERDGLFVLAAVGVILSSVTVMIEVIVRGFEWLASFF